MTFPAMYHQNIKTESGHQISVEVRAWRVHLAVYGDDLPDSKPIRLTVKESLRLAEALDHANTIING